MRFVHTADWQIGMRALHLDRAADIVREARIASIARVGAVARDAGADFVLVAGDVFEDHGVDRALVQRTADALEAIGLPVYLLPGNHDPRVPGAVWEHPAFRALRDKRVFVLDEPRPLEVPGGVLYPCPATSRTGADDPTEWIAAANDPSRRDPSVLHVGVAHGTVDTPGEHEAQGEPYFPIARDAATRAGLAYLALGHFHSTGLYRDEHGAVRMAYSGTHEPTRFGERDSGNVLVVDLPSPDVPPSVTPVRTGQLRWRSVERTLRAQGDVAQLGGELDALELPLQTLLRVCLDGVLFASEQTALLHLADRLASRFLFARSEMRARPAPDDTSWIDALAAGPVREAAAALCAKAQSGGPEGEIASIALLELFSLASSETASHDETAARRAAEPSTSVSAKSRRAPRRESDS